MIEKLIGLLTAKRQTEPDKWVGSTVTSTDAAASYGRGSVEGEALVRRCQQWVMVCATRNATECTTKPVRLYVPKRSGGKKRSWAKAVTGRARNDYLRDRSRGPGVKAAFYAENAGDVEEVVDHPILDVLRKPNPWMFGHDFVRKFYLFGELTGNRYVHIVEADGTVQLYPMASQDTRPVPHPDGFLAGYWYGRDSTIQDFFTPDEVYHSQFMPSPVSPYTGIGPLHAVYSEADIDAAATENELAMWRNGARPDWVLGIDPSLSANKEYVEQLRAQVNKDHRGVRNRGKFLIAGATEVKPLQFTPREMEYILGKENVEQRIWAAFGVPESEVKLNDSNLASSKSGSAQYLRQTIKPRINAVAEEWTETLLRRYGIEPGEMWFAYDNPVPEDVQARVTQTTTLTNSAVLTVNEARAEDGREPIEGGDVLRFNGTPLDVLANPPQPMGMGDPAKPGEDEDDVAPATPANATGQEASAAAGDVQATALNGAQVTSLRDLAVDVATGQLPVGSATALAAAAFPLIPPETLTAIFAPLESFEPEQTPEQQAKIEAAKNPKPMPVPPNSPADGAAGPGAKTATAPPPSVTPKSLRAHACGCCTKRADEVPPVPGASALEQAAKVWLASITASVLDRIPTSPSDLDRFTVFDRAALDQFVQTITPPLEQVFAGGVEAGRAMLPASTPPFEVLPSLERRYLSQVTGQLVESVSSTVDARIRETLAQAFEQGTPMPEMIQAVKADLEVGSLNQAATIARTEANRISEGAKEIAWMDSGVVAGKQWILSGNPCPICVALADRYNRASLGSPFIPRNGVIETSDGPYVADFRDINGGDAHPNCACTTIPILKGEA